MVICLERGAACFYIIVVQLILLLSKTPPFFASFKSRLVLPFWYRFTQVVLEKRPLNGCSSSSSSSSSDNNNNGVGTMGTGGYIVPPSLGLVPLVLPKSKMRLMSKF